MNGYQFNQTLPGRRGHPAEKITMKSCLTTRWRRTAQSINGSAETVAFDALGRVTSQVNALGTFTPTYSFGSTPSFRLGKVTLPNSLSTVLTFANAVSDEHLLAIKNLTTSNTVLSQFDYQYDLLARITQWTRQADSGTPTVQNFEYDFEGQLLNEVITPQGQSAKQAYTYGYDASGNRTSEEVDLMGTVTNATVTTSSYNAVNQLYSRTGSGNLPVRFKGTSSEPGTATVNGQSATITVNPASSGGRIFTGPANVPAGNQTVPVTATDLSGNTATKAYSLTVIGGTNKAYAYDNNGNCTTAGTATYDWDGADRLVAINNGPLRSEFTYDGFGRRVQMVEKNNGTVTGTKRLVWAGMALAEERSSLNAVTKRFFGGGEQIAGVNYYFARDHLGSVREMTDANGTVVARYDYDPYGRRTKLSGGLDADFGYTGHYVHAPSGLYLTLFRAYDADSGRWPNRDPIGERGGLNLYGYVGNNPVNFYDPYGLAIGDWWDARTWFNSGFTESWSDQANSIGKTLGDALAGNWDDIGNNYDDSTLGQAEAAGPGVHTATKVCIGTATAATAAAAAIGTFEFAALGNQSIAEINVFSEGNVFKVVSRPFQRGFRIDPAHHGKPWGHTHWWEW